MSDGAISLIFLGLIVIMIINLLVANEFSKVADDKGYEGKKYFWFTFFLGIIGCLLVIALPNINATTSTVQPSNDELPEL